MAQQANLTLELDKVKDLLFPYSADLDIENNNF